MAAGDFRRMVDLCNVMGIGERIPPDKWNEMTDEAQSEHVAELEHRHEYARRTHGWYRDACRELGYGDGTLSFGVWAKTEVEAMNSHVRQMQEAVTQHRAYLASLPEGWGAW